MISDATYRCPQDLLVTPTPLRRIMVVGSCLAAAWPAVLEQRGEACACDFFLVNNTSQLPDAPPRPPAEYDFQIVQVPLRAILPEQSYYRLSFGDRDAYQRLLDESKERLRHCLHWMMRWNREHGILTFVYNFLLPQQNPMGRLLPRYDVRNLVYIVEKLNETICEIISEYKDTYLFDHDQLVSTFGRKYFQDDAVLGIYHNGTMGDSDYELDSDRLEPAPRITDTYPMRVLEYFEFAWTELTAMYRTVRQFDAVKLVVVDLDDTLWRGVAAERDEFDPQTTEGWPNGVVEALGHLKRRGVLLGLVSRNDEDRIAAIWDSLMGPKLALEDFAVRKINWRPKIENIEEMLHEVNLLPRSAVFIDDNPAERAAATAAFPGLRSFGPNPMIWRRILLWSPETQVATITAESEQRTEMVRAQVAREAERPRFSREEFLTSLDLQVELVPLDGPDHPGMVRLLELINKTNQFNTTGIRWTRQGAVAAFAAGAHFWAFSARDRFTRYGVIGAVIVEGHTISQFVMSCRVAGLDVEVAVISELLRKLREKGADCAAATLVETPLNLLCRDFYEKCGFVAEAGQWHRSLDQPLPGPPHILVAIGEPANAQPASCGGGG